MARDAQQEDPLALVGLGDDAITNATQDRLDRGPFAVRAADLIRTIGDASPSSVAGLIGPWGSGKTSVLALINERLAGDDRWTVVDFNPWELSDVASLVREFLTTLTSAMGDNRPARDAVSKYARKLAPFAGLIPMVGDAASKAIEATGGLLLGDTSLAAARADLTKALAKAKTRILVMIDDVDRLQADELTTVLKLVRLVGRLPSISYVLAYDESTLLDVLAGTEVGGGSRRRALAYLDKIVQLRLDLPPVSTYRIRAMVNEGIDSITSAAGITLTETDTSRLSSVYFDCLEPSLAEPRQIKRFFGQLAAVYELVADEVDFVDFFLITFLRVFYPSVQREVLAAKADLTGTKLEVERTTNEERIAHWQKVLADRHGLDQADVERVMQILGALFARLDRYGSGAGSVRSLGSAEYFDRYMYLAIAPDDFPDAKVRAAIDEAIAGPMGSRCEELVGRLVQAAQPIVEKLLRYEPPTGETARALLTLGARVAAATPDNTGFLGSTSRRAHRWVTALLEQSDIPDPQATFGELRRHLSLNQVAAALSAAKGEDLDDRQTPVHLSHLGDVVGHALRSELDGRAATPPAALGTSVLWTVAQWEHFIGDSETTRSWLRSQVDEGAWPAEDIVAIYVTVAISETGRPSLMDVNLSSLDIQIGIDWILERFTPTLSQETIDWYGGTDTSFAERRRRAHHVLAQEAARRRAATATERTSGSTGPTAPSSRPG